MPPDTTQTSSRHPQGIPREHNMPTDDNRRQQTLPDTQNHWQVLFEYVWWCLLAFVVVCWHVVFPGAVWGVSGRCLGGVWGCSEWFSWKLEALGCVLGVSGFWVPAVWSQNTNLAKPWKVWRFVTWPYWDIKISKPPYVPFPKKVGFNQFM